MKKIAVLLFASLLVLSIFYFQNKPIENTTESSPSGAYHALNFLAQARTYPYKELPAEAHFAAWERMKSKYGATAERSTDHWKSLGPHNIAGRMLSLAFNPQNPNTLYAGSASGGLWRSYTAGLGEDAWHQVNIEWPVLGVSNIAFAPKDSMTIYIGTGEVYNYDAAGTGAAYRNTRGSYGMGILKSTDGGVTWTRSLDWAYNQQHGIWAIKVDPNNSEIVYAATTEGVYKSIDAGDNWNKIHDVVMATDLVINQENTNELLVGCGNFASPGFGIYRSTDAGATWTKNNDSDLPNDFLGKIQLGASPSHPNIVYASIGNGFGFSDGASWLCRSDDFGTTWSLQNTEDYSQWQGWFAHDVAVHPERRDEITAIGINVWKSTNGGNNLQLVTVGGVGDDNPPIAGPDGDSDYVHSDAHDVIYQPGTNFIFVASDGGVHVSEDGGTNWRSRNARLQTVQFYNGFSNSYQDSTFCIGGLQDNGTIVNNGDLTWRRVSGGDGSWTAINPTDDQFFFTSSQFLNTSRFTPNNRFGMRIPSEDPTAFIAPFVMAADGQTMYAGSSNMAYSPNGGRNWIAGFQTPGNPVLSMEVSSQKFEKVYFATAPSVLGRGSVFVSNDRGQNAIDITQNLPDRYPMDMTVDPTNDEIAYITFSGFGTGHVFKTTNSGAAWTDISADLPDVPTNAIVVDPMIPNHVYVGNDLGVFFSPNGGNSWEPWQDGLMEAVMIFDLKISPMNRKLRAATHGNGVFDRNLVEDVVSVNESIQTLSDASIFPNPLRETGTLKFDLSEKTDLDIRIFDLSGKELKAIFKGQHTKGEHQIDFNTNELSSGFYFVRMKSEQGQFSMKFQKT